jgi:hypothetical protein
MVRPDWTEETAVILYTEETIPYTGRRSPREGSYLCVCSAAVLLAWYVEGHQGFYGCVRRLWPEQVVEVEEEGFLEATANSGSDLVRDISGLYYGTARVGRVSQYDCYHRPFRQGSSS